MYKTTCKLGFSFIYIVQRAGFVKQHVWYFGKSRRKKRKIKGYWLLAQKKTMRNVRVV